MFLCSKQVFPNMLAVEVIHELVYELRNANLCQIPMCLVPNETHSEYVG